MTHWEHDILYIGPNYKKFRQTNFQIPTDGLFNFRPTEFLVIQPIVGVNMVRCTVHIVGILHLDTVPVPSTLSRARQISAE